jgi:HKD family nuclease
MTTDLTFITNENDESLLKRFQDLIKDVRFFDCLVGYFYSSGFNLFYKELESTEKVRILIGIGTSRGVIEAIQSSKQQSIDQYSTVELKEQFNGEVTQELEKAPDKKDIEEGVRKFIEWIRKDKLEIRAYPSSNIHAKLYILTFAEGDRDVGRVITGSSNFTKAGFVDNLEFNVELKNRSDYEFAKAKSESFQVIFKMRENIIREFENKLENIPSLIEDVSLQKTLTTGLQELSDDISTHVEGKNNEEIIDQYCDTESIKRLILDSVDYSMLYILAGFTFPHWKYTRYPDDKLKPFDYTMDIGIVKTTPEIIVHLKRIFDKI